MVRAGLTPDRLARAGAELADEVGFEQVTISEVARRFDVKVASLYSHVASSHDLKTRIALLALEELADRGAAAMAGGRARTRWPPSPTSTATTPASTPAGTPRPSCRSTPRPRPPAPAPARPDDPGDPARLRPDRAGPDARGPAARQRLPRLRHPRAGGRVQPQRPRLATSPGRASRTPSTPCSRTGRRVSAHPGRPPHASRTTTTTMHRTRPGSRPRSPPTWSAAPSSWSGPSTACSRTGCPPGPAPRSPTASSRWRSPNPPAYASSSAPGPPPRAGHPAHQAGVRRRPAPPGRRLRPGRRRPPGGPGQRRRRQHPHHRHDHRAPPSTGPARSAPCVSPTCPTA